MMNSKYIKLFCVVGVLAPTLLFVSEPIQDKVALVVWPYDDYPWQPAKAVTQQSIEYLQAYGFTIVTFGKTNIKISKIVARQVVIVYSGHSDPQEATIQVHNGVILSPNYILENIFAKETILLTNVCYGIHWHNYTTKNRIIISATDNNTAHIHANFDCNETHCYTTTLTSPTIASFLALCRTRSAEQAFVVWKIAFLRYFTTWNFNATPLMSDNIQGETYIN